MKKEKDKEKEGQKTKEQPLSLDSPSLYLNRELSWLEFNERVLEEAQDKTNPILERLKFLAITASNMDEFFMVRVSNLMDQEEAEVKIKDASGLTPIEQLAEISKKVHKIVYKQYNCLNRSILTQLGKHGIFICEYSDLQKEQKEYVYNYFRHTIYPILTPMAIDQGRPFPFLANRSLNLIVSLDNTDDELFAVIQVPSVIPRYIELPLNQEGKRQIILLEDIIKEFCQEVFTGYKVSESYAFRITRNFDLEIDEEDTDDLLFEIERSIKKRKWGEPVRLEIEKNMSPELKNFLEEALEIGERDIYEISGPLDLTLFFQISGLKGCDHLRNKPLVPQPATGFINKDIFEAIKEDDILVNHPYESFDCVLDFVRRAAIDPKVLAIKQTLYRVSGDSPIVNALIQAAENGKQVTVLVELKARFDEENNILWAKKLEKSGCHVVYGLVGLKTHCKICLVVRKEEDGILRYVHLGTGNYNDSTAKIYTDHGLFTCKETFGRDISGLLNVLTGYSRNLSWNKIAVAPTSLRSTFLKLIETETENAALGRPSGIIAKMNSLVDTGIIQALYKASMAGVEIKLIVRGICCLKSGVPGISENITVVSIVDRFLEHSRIFYFENNNDPKVFLSSADWMPRNLDRRVEVAFPIDDQNLKERLIETLRITLSDTVKLRVQNPDGTYSRVDKRGKEHLHSQLKFYELACERYSEALEVPVSEKFRPILAYESIDDEEDEEDF